MASSAWENQGVEFAGAKVMVLFQSPLCEKKGGHFPIKSIAFSWTWMFRWTRW
jgi:hypothetical protein